MSILGIEEKPGPNKGKLHPQTRPFSIQSRIGLYFLSEVTSGPEFRNHSFNSGESLRGWGSNLVLSSESQVPFPLCYDSISTMQAYSWDWATWCCLSIQNNKESKSPFPRARVTVNWFSNGEATGLAFRLQWSTSFTVWGPMNPGRSDPKFPKEPRSQIPNVPQSLGRVVVKTSSSVRTQRCLIGWKHIWSILTKPKRNLHG